MKLRVLGASGAEFPNFHPPAFLLDDSILLDAGTIGSVLNENEQWKIRHVLLTHAHLDHIKAIPFLADNIIIRNKKHYVTLYAISPVLKTLKRNLLNHQVWPDFTELPTEETAVLRMKSIKARQAFKLNGYTVTAYKVDHAVPATGFVLKSKSGQRLLYTGDTGPTEAIWAETKELIDCAIIEISMPNRMKKMAIMTGHLTAGLLKHEIAKMHVVPKQILITHPKPQHLDRIKKEIKALKMNNIKLLKDGDVYKF